jgi:GxxExxY protein
MKHEDERKKEFDVAELILAEEDYNIVGAGMSVHGELKSKYLEAVYQEAMEIELSLRGIPFGRQVPLPIFYKGRELKTRYVADLISYAQVLVELKVMERLTSKEEAQLLNYMAATRIKVGVLINFGDPGRLDWKRFVL